MESSQLFINTQNTANSPLSGSCSGITAVGAQISDAASCSSSYSKLASSPQIKSTSPYFRKNNFRIEGHRGFGRYQPENTYQAFTSAISANLDGIELDVWLTSDKIPVIIHTVGGLITFDDGSQSTVYETSYEELRSKKILGDNTIPTLEEVLTMAHSKICVNIEFKGTDLDAAEITLRTVQQHGMCEQVQFSSFNWKFYEALKIAANKLGIVERIPFAFLVENGELLDDRLFGGEAGDGVTLDWRLLNSHRSSVLYIFEKAKLRGYNVKVYFSFKITEIHEIYQELETLGVETVITNEPALVKSYFEIKNSKNNSEPGCSPQLEAVESAVLINI